MKEKKNFEYKETDSDGQYNINFDEKPEEITDLNFPEDFSKVKKDPVAYEALMKQIAKLEEQNEIDEMEKATEAKEKAEEEEQRKIELRESIFKVLEKENNDAVNDRDDNTGQFQHFANLAREIKDKQITGKSKKSNKSKNKKGRWGKTWDAIQNKYLTK